jgi:uncharacterized membrane protein (UPF0127 family)
LIVVAKMGAMRIALVTLTAAVLTLAVAAGAQLIPAGTPERATAIIDTGERRVRVAVELAETPKEWSLGLMHRRSLARNAGMVFLFPDDVRGGFWMKNTLIPLSIAFFDARGRILRILHMTPCRRDPCRTYNPGVAYRGALEVNRGAFTRWRVTRGDTIRIVRRPS